MTSTRPGPKPKPAAIKRTEWLRIRVSPIEKAAAEARAQAAGLNVSDYARLQTCGAAPAQTAARHQEVQRVAARTQRAPGDRAAIEQQIRREQPGLPAHSVRVLAARRMARE